MFPTITPFTNILSSPHTIILLSDCTKTSKITSKSPPIIWKAPFVAKVVSKEPSAFKRKITGVPKLLPAITILPLFCIVIPIASIYKSIARSSLERTVPSPPPKFKSTVPFGLYLVITACWGSPKTLAPTHIKIFPSGWIMVSVTGKANPGFPPKKVSS